MIGKIRFAFSNDCQGQQSTFQTTLIVMTVIHYDNKSPDNGSHENRSKTYSSESIEKRNCNTLRVNN